MIILLFEIARDVQLARSRVVIPLLRIYVLIRNVRHAIKNKSLERLDISYSIVGELFWIYKIL